MHVASFLKVGRGQQTYPKFNKQKKTKQTNIPHTKKIDLPIFKIPILVRTN